MMKKFYGFLCFLILFWNSSPSAIGKLSEPCDEENFQTGYFIGNLITLKDFVQFLADMGIDTTSKFINLKNEGGLPDGISDAPLEDYTELEGKWSNLWNRVREARSPIERNRAVERKPSPQLEQIGRNQIQKGLQTIQKSVSNKIKPGGKSRESSYKRVRFLNSGPSEEKKKEFLALVTADPRITRPRLAEELGMTVRKVDQAIAILKRERRLARIGSGEYGRWVVLQPGAEPPDYQPLALAEEKKEDFLALVTEDPQIIRAKLAEKLEVSLWKINRITAVLKKEGRLARIGGGDRGRWEVLQPGAEPSRYQGLAEEKKEDFLALVREDSQITRPRLAEKLEVSFEIIDQIIAILKREKRLARVGSRNGGHWIALQDGAEPPDYQPLALAEEKKEDFLALVTEDPQIIRPRLAEKLEVPLEIIVQIIAILKREKRLARVGRGNGRWVPLQPGVKPSPSDFFEERKRKFLALVIEDSQITRPKLAEKLEVSLGTLDRIIAILKKEKRLTKEKSHWKAVTTVELASPVEFVPST